MTDGAFCTIRIGRCSEVQRSNQSHSNLVEAKALTPFTFVVMKCLWFVETYSFELYLSQ